MITMYDTVTLKTVPPNPPAVAGYVGGFWPTYSPLVAAFPNAHHLSIAVTSSEDADCLDVENGDASPSEAPAWVQRQQARGVVRPVVYASVSVMPVVLRLLENGDVARTDVRVWTAHYTFKRHLCDPTEGFGFNTTSDATQWSDRALNRNLDVSVCADTFFDAPKPLPPVKNSLHYDWFDARSHWIVGQLFNERSLVKSYDVLRAAQTPDNHPNRLQLAVIRQALRIQADRVWRVAHHQPLPNGRPSWSRFHRGWRYQHLAHRAQGMRFAV